MALIRESTFVPQKEQQSHRQKRLDSSVHSVNKAQKSCDMTYSNYVKEELAKGWYEGGKVDGLRSGYGIFHYNGGGKYCGDWKDSKMHGKGTLYYADERIAYQGDWRNDSLNGKGKLYNENPQKVEGRFDFNDFDASEDIWVCYEGQFKDDDKSGFGVLILSNG